MIGFFRFLMMVLRRFVFKVLLIIWWLIDMVMFMIVVILSVLLFWIIGFFILVLMVRMFVCGGFMMVLKLLMLNMLRFEIVKLLFWYLCGVSLWLWVWVVRFFILVDSVERDFMFVFCSIGVNRLFLMVIVIVILEVFICSM